MAASRNQEVQAAFANTLAGGRANEGPRTGSSSDDGDGYPAEFFESDYSRQLGSRGRRSRSSTGRSPSPIREDDEGALAGENGGANDNGESGGGDPSRPKAPKSMLISSRDFKRYAKPLVWSSNR